MSSEPSEEAAVDLDGPVGVSDPPPAAAAASSVTEAAAAPPGAVVVPRWVQAVLLPLALIGLYELARASGPVLEIVIIAGIIALVLNPLVDRLSRRLPHGLAIMAAYGLVLLLFAGVGLIVLTPVISELEHFASNVPSLTRQANTELNSIQRFFNHHGIPIHIRHQGQTALQSLQRAVLKQSNSIIAVSQTVLSTLLRLSVDAILILVLSIYLLAYAGSIGDAVRRILPPGDGTPEDDYPRLVQRAVGSYVRGQVLFTLIMGASAALVMWVFGLTGLFPDGSRFALFFGAFYGLMEFIPYVGPIIGPVPAILAALFTHPISALWVLGAFIALQQLEGHLVAPQLFRISLRINPILVILALLVGYQIWGIAGALVALPLATVVRQTVLYLRAHLELEPWTRNPAAPSPPLR